ncbi:alcohol dehydrogenase catalytic domain-containing protein [Bradyrhizobium tropiciagri]|uniref:zinc-dependent alcohol dehydrogenase n=1 Tax=Bradyrhizobium tropiciagri TaxID=312253 RepID=UPI001BA89ED6|nr:alcohol dehydrogenase catalytic domain-containing protein [Bradyrhizobium tropiciagri]MBR0896707.1 alcohol dehydrogenase catalytic domain-containing protein [Bradyrhizobium tropiciagri]
MKALVYAGERSVRWTDVKEPQPVEGEDIVDVLVAGICGTDLGAVRNGRPPLPNGLTFGHEFVGRRRRDGALVAGNPILSCGICRSCREERRHLCERRKVLGVHRPGAFAQSISVPAGNLVETGALDLIRAAMVEPIATALHAWRLSSTPCSDVAVLGAGPIGMSLLHVLKAHRIKNITMTDIVPERRALALQCGADIAIEAADAVYDAIIDTVGAVATRRNAIENVRVGGSAVLVGLHAAELAVAGGPIVAGERTVQGSFGYTPDEFNEAIVLAASLDTRWITTIPFRESEQAFSALLAGSADPACVKLHFSVAD